MNVLLLSHSNDFFTIDRVEMALKELGLQPFRIDSDLFPENIQLKVSMQGNVIDAQLVTPKGSISLNSVQAVWMRRLWAPTIDESIEEPFRSMCVKESQTVLRDVLDLLHDAFWFDDLDAIRIASNKTHQLRLASKYGINIPPTLLTNDPAEAISFYHKQDSIITKMNTQTAYGMGRSVLAMHTYRVEEEHLEDLDSLQHCPMIFQQEIKKKREYRVVYVSGKFFVGTIDTTQTSEGKTDWRKTTQGNAKWEHGSLPQGLKDKLTKFMNELNLQFGAIDLIEAPSNEFYFLEVNPIGEWGMLEKDLDLPISKAIATSIYENINA